LTTNEEEYVMINYNINTEVNESTFDDLKELQEITTVDQIHHALGDVILLDRFAKNFEYLYNRVVDVASLCWGNKDEKGNKLQHTFIKFKKSLEADITYELPLNRFMMRLVFLRPVIPYLEYINIDDFILTDFMSKKTRVKIQDKIVETLASYGKTIHERKVIMAKMSLDLKGLLLIFSMADMQVFTAENLFLDHYRDSEVIREINNTEYPPTMQTSDIVTANKEKYKILEAEMLKRGNPFFIDNKYTPIIKAKQMEELYINFSQIPDGKNIVPVIMNGNGFRAGYHDMPVMYAGAIAARVPDIMNEEYMGSAGYFARNLWILTYGTLSRTIWDCGSINPIEIEIDECMLEMMDGRYYQEKKNVGTYKIFNKNDTSLLGKKLWFRSPATCNLNEDCCHVCYGTKALKVGELDGGFIYTTELLTKDVGQKILSAKHLLKTNSEKIEFTDGYDKYFIMENSTLIPMDDKKFDIYFKEDYLDNISENLTIYIGKDLFPITVSKYASIHIPDVITDAFKEVLINDETYYKISSHKVLELGEGKLCQIIPVNIMMTERYMKIMRMFENDITKFSTIEGAVTEMAHLIQGIIPIYSTHTEIIIGHLVRSIENKLLRPNWTKPDPQYQIMRLKTALANHESVTVALAFEQTRHHLLHAIFDERNKINRVGARSFEDYIFGGENL
jgi:hypothetical protein